MKHRFGWMRSVGCTMGLVVLATSMHVPVNADGLAEIFQRPITPELVPIRLSLTPMDAPELASKVHLLPMGTEQIPGNAPVSYLRVFAPMLWRHKLDDFEQIQLMDSWTVEMISTQNREQVRTFVRDHQRIFRELDLAARKKDCDWELESRLDSEGLGLDTPELLGLHNLTRYLRVRIRFAIVEGNIDEALTGIRTGLAMARHAGEGPTVMHAFVSVAITAMMLDLIDELLADPKAPNLYWALSELPQPWVHPHRWFMGEIRKIHGSFPEFRALKTKVMTEAEANQALSKIFESLAAAMMFDHPEQIPVIRDRAVQTKMVASRLAEAKRELIARKVDLKRLEAMPNAQIVLLAAVHAMEDMQEDAAKWLSVPYRESHGQVKAAEKKLLEWRDAPIDRMPFSLFARIIVPIEKIQWNFARTDRKFALLRTSEAIRMHAAANGNALPKSLVDITLVPIPNDPMTGKSFEYTLKDGEAHLFAPPPMGETANRGNAVRYVLTVRK